jgi:hypothetical protein
MDNQRVCPYLVGMRGARLDGPLAQLQSARATAADTLRLVRTLNALLARGGIADPDLDDRFEEQWPGLQEALTALPGPRVHPRSSMLVELLLRLRKIERREPELEELSVMKSVVHALARRLVGGSQIRVEIDPDRAGAPLVTIKLASAGPTSEWSFGRGGARFADARMRGGRKGQRAGRAGTERLSRALRELGFGQVDYWFTT